MAAIGFFDSGVGGISVLRSARQLLPYENYIYFGDNKNAPYGPRPLHEIQTLTRQGVDLLLEQNIKALVIACNTATSAYATQLRQTLQIPVVAMEPALKPASTLRRGGQIIVLATNATLRLEKFQTLMKQYGHGAVPVVGDGLVELVESGRYKSAAAIEQIQRLLAPHQAQPIDAIVLGCTHFVFLRQAVSAAYPGIPLIDGNEGTVQQLGRVLQANGIREPGPATGSITLLSSGGEPYVQLMNTLLNEQ